MTGLTGVQALGGVTINARPQNISHQNRLLSKETGFALSFLKLTTVSILRWKLWKFWIWFRVQRQCYPVQVAVINERGMAIGSGKKGCPLPAEGASSKIRSQKVCSLGNSRADFDGLAEVSLFWFLGSILPQLATSGEKFFQIFFQIL